MEPLTFGAYLDLRFAALGNDEKVNQLVAKTFFDSFFLLSDKTGNLVSIGGAKLAVFMGVDKSLVEAVHRVCRGVGFSCTLWRRLGLRKAFDA